ncbi:pyrimidine-nucleoside phosphorylase [Mycoplasma sp. CAG:877]|jgi:pyrimidine-nucleoside phosphorylase|nr:pyrimidine-nucleoside phosphorylase [Mycoplasma sp. CAG:877]
MIVDIINKKRLGLELSYSELDFFFNGYLKGKVKDYQMSSLLMAICINGMTDEEIFALTKIFIDSGDVLDFSEIPGIKVDKHSTGGVGDKTTLIIAPIVASLGIPVVKMSGRGLGYTGGTIDKLESIKGFNIALSDNQVFNQVKKIGVVVTGQTADLAPMDKAIYALRDVTGTVSSIPLIASSIMSKKIAAGADKILIDIKVGNGALLQKKSDANKLSDLMKKIGKFYNREVRTIISDMNVPLGHAIGNSIEVMEAIKVLKGEETNNNLVDLCIELATEMVSMGKNIDRAVAYDEVVDSIKSGKAYNKFLELVKAQGGKIDSLRLSDDSIEIVATEAGIVKKINALELGKLSVKLGAGRVNKEDKIDYNVGIYLNKLVGDTVKKGDILATIYVNKNVKLDEFDKIFTIK